MPYPRWRMRSSTGLARGIRLCRLRRTTTSGAPRQISHVGTLPVAVLDRRSEHDRRSEPAQRPTPPDRLVEGRSGALPPPLDRAWSQLPIYRGLAPVLVLPPAPVPG